MDLIYLCRDIGLLKISRLQLQILFGTLSMAFNCGLHAQPLPEVTVTLKTQLPIQKWLKGG